MKTFINLLKYFVFALIVSVGVFNGKTFSQGNTCAEATDISLMFSDAFSNPCIYVVDGPYTNLGATVDTDAANFDESWTDSEGGCCACESEFTPNPDVSNPVWFKFTPANSGDYSIYATGDDSSQNGCTASFSDEGDDDTQILLLTGNCGELSLYDCNEDAKNALFFEAGAIFSFTAGTTYYLVIDGFLGVQGDFCLEIAFDTGGCVTCGDGICGLGFGETYCSCDEECPCDLVTGYFAAYEDGAWGPVGFGLVDIAFCPEFLSSISGVPFDLNFTYLGYSFFSSDFGYPEDCANNLIRSATVKYNVGILTDALNENDYPSGSNTVPTGTRLFFKLTDEEIANNNGITLDICIPDNGNGNQCCLPKFISFDPMLTPRITDPYCPCSAGSVSLSEITACIDGEITLTTNGDEMLDLYCPSDDGSGFQYAWRILVDIYGSGIFDPITYWKPYGSAATINVNEFFIDDFGVFGPDFTSGEPIPLTNFYSGELTKLVIQGGAVCLNSNGNVVERCVSLTDNEEGNYITVTYLPAGDFGCGQECTPGTVCDDGNPNTVNDTYTESCTCVGEVQCSAPIVGSFECD